MATTLRPDRGFPIEIGGITFHFLYTFAVIDDLQTLYDAPMSEILDRLTTDKTFYAAAGHIIEALIRNDLYNNGFENIVPPTFDQIMHVLTVKDTSRIISALFKSYQTDMPEKDEDDEPDEDPDQINVARLLILAKTEMHMSEDEFWKTTPRKYFKLFDEYVALKGGKKDTGGGIDDLP